MQIPKKLSLIILVITLISCKKEQSINNNEVSKYANKTFWAFYPEKDSCDIDIFFVAPTVYEGDSINFSMDIADSLSRVNFKGATQMEKGIYDHAANFYSPFYAQASLSAYEIRGYNNHTANNQVEEAFKKAYEDIETAFEHYLTQSNKPFVLAGFSQGSEILIKLIKNKLTTGELQKRHIATYAIGWRLTESDVSKHKQLKNAQSEKDLGVVITFSSEAEFINKSLIVPEKTLSINPLSWTTDTTPASSDLNLGACFTDYDGNIVNEIDNFTGAYICSKRGTLKVPDVDTANYPPIIPIFEKGEFHIYDYMFFYRNLQENVKTRIEEYKNLK